MKSYNLSNALQKSWKKTKISFQIPKLIALPILNTNRSNSPHGRRYPTLKSDFIVPPDVAPFGNQKKHIGPQNRQHHLQLYIVATNHNLLPAYIYPCSNQDYVQLRLPLTTARHDALKRINFSTAPLSSFFVFALSIITYIISTKYVHTEQRGLVLLIPLNS